MKVLQYCRELEIYWKLTLYEHSLLWRVSICESSQMSLVFIALKTVHIKGNNKLSLYELPTKDNLHCPIQLKLLTS